MKWDVVQSKVENAVITISMVDCRWVLLKRTHINIMKGSCLVHLLMLAWLVRLATTTADAAFRLLYCLHEKIQL